MLNYSYAQRDDDPPEPRFRETGCRPAATFRRENELEALGAELRYLRERARRELELAACATHARAKAIHLELANAYRARVCLLQPQAEACLWDFERGGHVPGNCSG